MNVTAPPVLRPEDFPEVDPKLLEVVTRGLRQLTDAVSSVPRITFKSGLRFTTGGGGTAYLDVATEALPEHAWVTRLAAGDGSDVTTAYSQTFSRRQDGVRFLFAGLAAATEYVCSVGYT